MDLLPISGADSVDLILYFGDAGYANYSTTLYHNMGDADTIGLTETAALAAAIQAALEGANCGYTVGTVTASYNSGTDELTITIPDTNAALGVVLAEEQDGVLSSDIYEFTQSNCV
jgi:hypothetical protein